MNQRNEMLRVRNTMQVCHSWQFEFSTLLADTIGIVAVYLDILLSYLDTLQT